MADDEEISSLHSAISSLSQRMSALEAANEPESIESMETMPGGMSAEGVDKKLDWFKEDIINDIEGKESNQRDEIRKLRVDIDEIFRRLRRISEETQTPPCEGTAGLTTLGDATEGSEAENSSSWAIGSGPVNVWMTSRVSYYEAGTETLWGYRRKFSYDSCGKLIAVSGETRYEVDVPTECVPP